jgi:hypothetical protein
MLGILLRVKHAKTKEEQSDRKNQPDSETHSPDAVIELLSVSRKDNHHNNTSSHKPRVDGKAGRQGR